MYHHLTEKERKRIARLVQAGDSQAMIARRLGRHRGTVSRELRRNATGKAYWPVAAQHQSERRRRQGRRRKLEDLPLQRYVAERLIAYWSPDEIAGRLRREFPHDKRWRISRQTIYAWLRTPPGGPYRRSLRRGSWRRKRPENAGRLRRSVSIRGRPPVVDRRRRFGDWEGDTLVGARQRGGVVSLVERKSRYALLGKVPNRRAAAVCAKMTRLYEPLPKRLRRTITLDNGKEFADHEQVAQATGLKVFFADPYCAWQRGTNENTNGLARQFLSKDQDLTRLSDAYVAHVQDLLNDRPRKCLGYRTPREVLARVALQI
jgi:IS30 family transposase